MAKKITCNATLLGDFFNPLIVINVSLQKIVMCFLSDLRYCILGYTCPLVCVTVEGGGGLVFVERGDGLVCEGEGWGVKGEDTG